MDEVAEEEESEPGSSSGSRSASAEEELHWTKLGTIRFGSTVFHYNYEPILSIAIIGTHESANANIVRHLQWQLRMIGLLRRQGLWSEARSGPEG